MLSLGKQMRILLFKKTLLCYSPMYDDSYKSYVFKSKGFNFVIKFCCIHIVRYN